MLLFYLVLAIGVSFLCSLFEAIILSISPAYIASLVQSGHRAGPLLERLKTKLDDSLAAILTLNTISHTIGSAGVGAEVLKQYGDSYVAIASAILTLLILVLSEIIPKTLGATYWRLLAPTAARGIQVFIWITYPFVIAFQGLSRLLGASVHAHTVTRDEIMYTAELGKQGGTLSEDEVTVINNLLRLRKVLVRDVMTPRTVVFALEQSQTVEQVVREHPKLQFSRIPIYDEQIDRIQGFVNRYELLQAHAGGNTTALLEELVRPIHKVPDTMSLGRVFDVFMKRREHLFAVFDEHGGFDGVISLEDVIETLLGVEITDEFDTVEDLREYAAKKWQQRRGKLPKMPAGEEPTP